VRVSAATDCRVFDVQRFSIHDGPGIRTTVFLEGCPLRCGWCQNPEAFRNGEAPAMAPEAVIAEVLKDRDYYAVSGGGLTVSGGEPLLHLAPVRALLEEAKRHGLHTCVQTSGAVPQAHVAAVLGLVDLFQFDLKHMDAKRHRSLTGAGTERIHENAVFLVEQGAHVQFRMPVLPGINDDDENLDRIAGFLREHGVRELRLVPYHCLYLDKYVTLGMEPGLQRLEPPTVDDVSRMAGRMAQHDLTVAVDG
jgi:pyruvate formate lyase activating enzyme